MSTDLVGFQTALRTFTGSVYQKHSQLTKAVASQVVENIVMNTPVDTGEARGEWQIGLDSPPTVKVGILDPVGDDTVRRCLDVIDDAKPSQIIWITNNADHISALEHGSSNQAPNGMVQNAVNGVREFGVK